MALPKTAFLHEIRALSRTIKSAAYQDLQKQLGELKQEAKSLTLIKKVPRLGENRQAKIARLEALATEDAAVLTSQLKN